MYPLKYLIKNCPLTFFEVSVTNADGTRKNDEKEGEEEGDKKEVTGSKSNQAKIQFFLD